MKTLSIIYKANMDVVKHYVDITQFGNPDKNRQPKEINT